MLAIDRRFFLSKKLDLYPSRTCVHIHIHHSGPQNFWRFVLGLAASALKQAIYRLPLEANLTGTWHEKVSKSFWYPAKQDSTSKRPSPSRSINGLHRVGIWAVAHRLKVFPIIAFAFEPDLNAGEHVFITSMAGTVRILFNQGVRQIGAGKVAHLWAGHGTLKVCILIWTTPVSHGVSLDLRCIIATSQRTTASVALGRDGHDRVVRADVLNGLRGCHETAGEQKQIHGEVYTKLAHFQKRRHHPKSLILILW